MRWHVHRPAAAPPLALAWPWPASELQAVLVNRPTVRVERRRLLDGRQVLLKLYFFPHAGARVAAAFRHTWLGVPKVVREACNLMRLDAAGVPVPRPLAWAVARDRCGFVRDSWLLLPWLAPGATLEDLLLDGLAPTGAAFWETVGASISRIHAAGCFYRHLAPRNLLVAPGGGLHWLDPARSTWVPPPLAAGRCAADLALFLLPLRELLPAGAAAAVLRGHGGGMPVDPVDLLAAAPWRLRRRCRGWIAREEARLRAGLRRRPPGAGPGRRRGPGGGR